MKLTLPLIFQDGCVLQQGKKCAVWGNAEPSVIVRAEIQGKTAETRADASGSWNVSIPALAPSHQETLCITAGEEQILCKNVAVGEVWILGGQSNMEFHMRYDEGYPDELQQPQTDRIRFFDQPEISYEGQDQDFDYHDFGFWRAVTTTDLEYFSAVGYYFAKKIGENLQVPIGLVGINWGGTPSCSWLSRAENLGNNPVWLEEYERVLKESHVGLAGDYILHPEWNTLTLEEEKKNPARRAAYELQYRKNPANNRGDLFGDPVGDELMYGMSHEKQLEILKQMEEQTVSADELALTGPLHQNRPGGLYETMLMKVAPYTARGVLWYQGETDSYHPEIYDKMLAGVIESWRNLWKETLPFYLVQLAPFEQWLQCVGDEFPLLREQQEKVDAEIEKVYLICTADVGLRYDIHPKKKKPVGERLACRALEEEYGKGGQPRSPEFAGIEWTDEKHAVLRFAYTDGCLHAAGDPVREFELEQNGKRIRLQEAGAKVTVDGEKLRIAFTKNASGCRLLYGKKPYFEGNLFNAAGFPVFPFEIKMTERE